MAYHSEHKPEIGMAITSRRKKGKKRLALSTRLGREHEQVMAKTKVGGGERFRSMKAKLAKKGAYDPGALASWIGRKKYGAKRMAQLSAAGRRG